MLIREDKRGLFILFFLAEPSRQKLLVPGKLGRLAWTNRLAERGR